MKKFLVLLLASVLLVSCSSASEDVSSGAESIEEDIFAGAHWLSLPKIGDPFSRRVELGKVKIASNLRETLGGYGDDERFAVIVCFISMIPENYLDLITHEGKTANEYLAQYKELKESDPEAANKAYQTYKELRADHYQNVLDSLSYTGEKYVPGPYGFLGTCQTYFAFYACMTKKEILELTCDEDEAFYVFTGNYK